MTETILAKSQAEILANAKKQLIAIKPKPAEDHDHILNETWSDESNPAIQFIQMYTSQSKKTHLSRLRRLAGLLGCPNRDFTFFDWTYFTAIRIESLINKMNEPYYENGVFTRKSPNTINGFLDTIKGVMKRAYKANIIDHKEWTSIADIKSIKNNLPKAGRMAEKEETQSLINKLSNKSKVNPPKAARDLAIFRLAFMNGIRRHEFALFTVSDYDSMARVLTTRGKGGKIADLNLNSESANSLDNWLEFRGREDGPLFLAVHKNGNISDKGITDSAIRYLFETYSKEAGISKLTAHDSRRTFLSNILDIPGIDPKTAMDLARHSSFDTTALYDRRSDERKKEALEQLRMD